MAQPGCFQSIQVCAIRATRLDATGAFVPGATNAQYTSDATIELESDPQYTDGDEVEVRNGCGEICSTFRGDDRLTGLDFSIELCELDIELIELLTGVTLLDDGAGNTLGYQLPLATATAYPGVALEAWSKAWADTTQSVGAITVATLDWWKWVWPKLRLRVDNKTLEDDFLVFSISGPGDENPVIGTVDPLPVTAPATAIGTGPGIAGPAANDWPISPGVIQGREAVYLSDQQAPAGVCGWTDLVD